MVLGAVLLFAASVHPSVAWRLDVLRLKASGRLTTVSTADLLTRLFSSKPGEDKGDGWVNGTVTLDHDGGEGPCPAVFDTPLGKIHAQLEDEFDVEWFVNKALGLHQKQTIAGLMPVVEPGDVVIEAGPWAGAFVRWALHYGAARVIAIEPIPDNLECLRRGLADEIAAGRVVVIEAAAWHSPGAVRMKQLGPNNFTGGTEGWHVADDGDLEVRAVTIDEVVAELGLGRVDLIEMDIEGAERHALTGSKETILRFGPQIAACIHHLPDDPEAVPAVVEQIRPEYRVRRNERHILFFD